MLGPQPPAFGAVEDLRVHSLIKPPYGDRTFVVLGPGDDTLLYAWPDYRAKVRTEDHNVLPWATTLDRAHTILVAGALQQDITDIVLKGTTIPPKYALIDIRPGQYKWDRVRSRYSLDLKRIVQELLRRGLVVPCTPVKLGNWASLKGETVGTAAQIAGRPDLPPYLVLYHGTSTLRLEQIQAQGLQAVPVPLRVWKRGVGGERGHPLYREVAAYLTATKETAEYYARKAVQVARRAGYSGIEPVVLRLRVPKQDYVHLRADDDYLDRRRFEKCPASENDWFDSLQWFGQVAFVGTIPPGRLEVV